MSYRSIGTFSGTVVGIQLKRITNLFVIRPDPTPGRSRNVYAWFDNLRLMAMTKRRQWSLRNAEDRLIPPMLAQLLQCQGSTLVWSANLQHLPNTATIYCLVGSLLIARRLDSRLSFGSVFVTQACESTGRQ